MGCIGSKTTIGKIASTLRRRRRQGGMGRECVVAPPMCQNQPEYGGMEVPGSSLEKRLAEEIA
ncbi:Hypothetical predicted protein [Podarcis lilfordi]|uniref:Uncharacterized protein n=1 Tax=Podarcis lilfordi TaxID=74358 RepID=A0AA35P7Q4_9SAUR|nr:Hypothetical predicted protein [Podarcis lilfordi]